MLGRESIKHPVHKQNNTIATISDKIESICIILTVGWWDGPIVGWRVGFFVGSFVGSFVGLGVGDFVGLCVGDVVGDFVGFLVGGFRVGNCVWISQKDW